MPVIRAPGKIAWLGAVVLKDIVLSNVELTRRVITRNLVGQIHQLICGVTHGRNNDNNVVSSLFGLDNALGDALDALSICNGRSAKLLHNHV